MLAKCVQVLAKCVPSFAELNLPTRTYQAACCQAIVTVNVSHSYHYS